MQRYTKQAVTIEAVQWLPTWSMEATNILLDSIKEWAGGAVRLSDAEVPVEETCLIVTTAHGNVVAKPTDWILKGPIDCWPVDAGQFETCYRPESPALSFEPFPFKVGSVIWIPQPDYRLGILVPCTAEVKGIEIRTQRVKTDDPETWVNLTVVATRFNNSWHTTLNLLPVADLDLVLTAEGCQSLIDRWKAAERCGAPNQ